jgi:ribosomal protein S1
VCAEKSVFRVSALDIQHPNEIVTVGDVVWVKVIDVDYSTKSVLVSMKFVAQHNGRDLVTNVCIPFDC